MLAISVQVLGKQEEMLPLDNGLDASTFHSKSCATNHCLPQAQRFPTAQDRSRDLKLKDTGEALRFLR
jgi:hypothetical protein